MKYLIAFTAAFCAAQLFFCIMTVLFGGRASAEIKLTADEIALKIRPKGIFPQYYWVKISVKNLYTGEQTLVKTGRIFACRKEAVCSFNAEKLRCGMISAEIIESKCGIFTLFFRKKAGLTASDTLLIMPQTSDESLKNISSSADESLEIRSKNGSPDGAREYQSGDRFGDIHMKLSAKAGKYMVRERFGDGAGLLKIAFDCDKNPDVAEKNAELLLTTVLESLAEGRTCRILYGENAADIQGSWEIEHAFSEIFSQCGAGFITERANVEIVGGEVRGL